MREFGTRPRPSPLVVQTAFVVGGFVVGAVVGQANLLVAFVILLATGVVVGTRERPRWETIVIGSALAAAGIDVGWVLILESPGAVPEALWRGGPLAIALGLLLAVACVVPGYLFGRAIGRAGETPVRHGESGPDVQPLPARRLTGPPALAYAGSGCLILVADVAGILWLLQGLSRLGP